jgi:hypothetical protein
MHDSESGQVHKDSILAVLRFHQVEVVVDSEQEGNFLLVRGDIVKSVAIEEWSERRFVQYLKRTFDIPIHHFYHPEMMGGDQGKPN